MWHSLQAIRLAHPPFKDVFSMSFQCFFDESSSKISRETCEDRPFSVPLLQVNIGSGVSVLRVDAGDDGPYFTRLGGTATGGAAFLGLVRMMTSAKTYPDCLALAQKGGEALSMKRKAYPLGYSCVYTLLIIYTYVS